MNANIDEEYGDEETFSCDHCGARAIYENSVSHMDVRYCASCDAAWRDHFHACAHRWDPEPTHDDFDEPARYCGRCCAVVTDDAAMRLFPLVCDGWADVADA